MDKYQEELLAYYEKELNYLRLMGAEFAQLHPHVAARVGLGSNGVADPQVERVIESVAFLTGRIQQSLNSEFPEIPSALLNILYPQFTTPIPSMAIASFEVDVSKASQLTSGFEIPKDTSLFVNLTDINQPFSASVEKPARASSTNDEQNPRLEFRTAYPITLWPITVTAAEFGPSPPGTSNTKVVASLRLRLEALGDAIPTAMDSVRFYLQGSAEIVNALYELLFAHTEEVDIWLDQSHTATPTPLPKDALSPVGFAPDEAVLAHSNLVHPAYRLLQEYFAFPKKFLFFDINSLDIPLLNKSLDILILLNQVPTNHVKNAISASTFRLNCTPIVNLFERVTDPIRLDQTQSEYILTPDVQQEKSMEIHSIQTVSSIDGQGKTETLEPFFSFKTGTTQSYWYARRQPSGLPSLPGTIMLLSFLNRDFNPQLPPSQAIYADTLCTNRHLADELYANVAFQLQITAPVSSITNFDKPTPEIDPPLDGATLWPLVSQLSLNSLSLSSDKGSLSALKGILNLYNFSDSATVALQIQSIDDMSCRKILHRLSNVVFPCEDLGQWSGFARGIQVALTFDEKQGLEDSTFLFASVLNHFFALYAEVNSFTQLVIFSEQRSGVWKKWQPMAGEQTLL